MRSSFPAWAPGLAGKTVDALRSASIDTTPRRGATRAIDNRRAQLPFWLRWVHNEKPADVGPELRARLRGAELGEVGTLSRAYLRSPFASALIDRWRSY